jgi:hypothetical protein
VADSRRYLIPPEAIRTIGVLVILREKVLRPILAGVGQPKMGRKPKNWSPIDEHYEAIRQDMFIFFKTGVLQPSNRQNLVDVFL